MGSQGELAVSLEGSGDQWKITGYVLPRGKEKFESNEIKNVFLSQTMLAPVYEDSEREVLLNYLEKGTLTGATIYNQNFGDTRSVFKYKPVALKTKPVVQELPAEFRIKREIIA